VIPIIRSPGAQTYCYCIVSNRIGGFGVIGAMHVNNRDVPEHRLWTIFVLY